VTTDRRTAAEIADFMQQNPTEAVAIMAKHAETSEADYREFANGTKLFSLDDNLTAFSPDKGDASLSLVGQKIGAFLKDHALVDKTPDLGPALHPEFVQALKQEGVRGAAPRL